MAKGRERLQVVIPTDEADPAEEFDEGAFFDQDLA